MIIYHDFEKERGENNGLFTEAEMGRNRVGHLGNLEPRKARLSGKGPRKEKKGHRKPKKAGSAAEIDGNTNGKEKAR